MTVYQRQAHQLKVREDMLAANKLAAQKILLSLSASLRSSISSIQIKHTGL